jgi:YebC/PmpR family DNA-binding regulatory protein
MGRGPSIEGRKNAVDAKRGKIFTKVIREISVAARAGGGDPASNPRLRSAIDKGLSVNMSKDVIERAVKKATGELEGVEYEEIRYEGYGPGGVAVIVDCMTDNRNRTVAEVRHAFSKCGGNLGTDGSGPSCSRSSACSATTPAPTRMPSPRPRSKPAPMMSWYTTMAPST